MITGELKNKIDSPDIVGRARTRAAEKDRPCTEKPFCVPRAEIVENGYDLFINKDKKVEYTPVEYPPTSEIMAELRTQERQIDAEMSKLERML